MPRWSRRLLAHRSHGSQPTQCNIAVWQGDAPPPLDPLGFRATGGAVEVVCRLRNLVPKRGPWLSGPGKRSAPTGGFASPVGQLRAGPGARWVRRAVAASSHRGAPTRARGQRSPANPQASARDLRGVEGGGAPLASPCRGPAKRGPKG